MADTLLRDLERALSAGDEHARRALASAYLRQGRAGDALTLLQGGPPEMRPLEQTAWEDALIRLRPASRVPGAAAYERLVGWVSGGRYAVLKLTDGLRVFDREAGAALPPSAVNPRLRPLATTLDSVYCHQDMQLVRLRCGPYGWETEPVLLPGGLLSFPGLGHESHADPQDRWIAGMQALFAGVSTTVHRTEDLSVCRSIASGRVAFDWVRNRVAWYQPQGLIQFASLTDDAEPSTLRVEGLGPLIHLFSFLRDGRLACGSPLRVLDLDRPGAARPICRTPVRGPARLSLDEGALLCRWRGGGPGLPARIPLGGTGTPAFTQPHPGEVLWHPRADLCAWLPREGDSELRVLKDARPRVLLRLPHGHRPLGWTPDGLGLLVLRRLNDRGSILELWGAS